MAGVTFQSRVAEGNGDRRANASKKNEVNLNGASARANRGTAVPAVGLAGLLPAVRDNAGGTPASPTGRMPVPRHAARPAPLRLGRTTHFDAIALMATVAALVKAQANFPCVARAGFDQPAL